MLIKEESSAPHIYSVSSCQLGSADDARHPASQGRDSNSQCSMLWKSESGLPEAGIRNLAASNLEKMFVNDELCHFVKGNAIYKSDNGEVIEVNPGTVVHFKQGWRGEIDVLENTRLVYMATAGGEAAVTPILRDVEKINKLNDWGRVEEPIEGVSKMSGVLLSREASGRAESGIWTCTPGTWRCVLGSDELCHFLKGRCTYTHDNGEVIEIMADTAAFFPQGWSGRCQVHETVRKVYMIR